MEKLLLQILDGQKEIKEELENINDRLDRIEKSQQEEVKVLHQKVRRVEKVFDSKVLNAVND